MLLGERASLGEGRCQCREQCNPRTERHVGWGSVGIPNDSESLLYVIKLLEFQYATSDRLGHGSRCAEYDQIDRLEVGRDVLLWNRSGPTGNGRSGEMQESSWKEGTKKIMKDEIFELALDEIDIFARAMIGPD